MHTLINTAKAPAAIGPYSQGIQTEHFLFVSGQLPIDPATGTFREGDIVAQATQSLKNVQAVVEAAAMKLTDVVKVNIFLSDMGNFNTVNQIYGQFFAEPFPARAVVEVSRLPKDALVEIEAIAVAG